jgi:hypothetical protein
LQTVEFANAENGKPVGTPTILTGSGGVSPNGYRAFLVRGYTPGINQVRLRAADLFSGNEWQMDLYANVFVTYMCRSLAQDS